MYEQAEQLSLFDPDGWFGKTSQEHSAHTEEKTSDASSKKQRGSSTPTPLYLDLRKENGLIAGASWETGGALLGEYLTHSFGESPSVAVESHLWQILQAGVLLKYYLSATACRGILRRAERRAERRGKKLPEILETALYQQIRNAEVYIISKAETKAA